MIPTAAGGCSRASPGASISCKPGWAATCRLSLCVAVVPSQKATGVAARPFCGMAHLEAGARLSCTARHGSKERFPSTSDIEASHHRYKFGISKRRLVFFFVFGQHTVRISFFFSFFLKPDKYFYYWSVKSSSSVYMIHTAASQNQHRLPEGG